MTAVTVNHVDAAQADDALPPPNTAIVRPLQHIRAVRERYLQRFADPAEAAAPRSAHAWSWALGESVVAPVTDRQTANPPSRADIETEIQAADERHLRGDLEKRADAAATVLRWLIGDDDRVPVRCENPGELVGGFGAIVRSRELITDVVATASEAHRRGNAASLDSGAAPDDRRQAMQDADYFDGVATTLSWVTGERTEAPITRKQSSAPTTRDIKAERIHAEDLIGQAASPWMADRAPTPWYGEGVKSSITWLLGYSTMPPASPVLS